MRTEKEIQKAHDMLDSVLNDYVLVSRENDPTSLLITKVMMEQSHDVLCWILGHERGEEFEKFMLDIEAGLFAKGVVFTDPNDPEPNLKEIFPNEETNNNS